MKSGQKGPYSDLTETNQPANLLASEFLKEPAKELLLKDLSKELLLKDPSKELLLKGPSKEPLFGDSWKAEAASKELLITPLKLPYRPVS